MQRTIFSFLIGVCALPACAAYESPPVSQNHPAHGDAASALSPAPSQTLAYTRADMPVSQPTSTATAGEREAGGQTVTAEGKVVATVPSASQIVVEHGEIKGFMDAMTMGYRAEPPTLLEGLKSGDKIRFTINVPNNAIIKIDKIK